MSVSAAGVWLARDGSSDSRGTVLCTLSFVVLASAALLGMLSAMIRPDIDASGRVVELIDYLRALMMPTAAGIFYLGLRAHVESESNKFPRERLLFAAIFITVSYGYFSSQPVGWPSVIVNFWIGAVALLCVTELRPLKRIKSADHFMIGALVGLLLFSWLKVIIGVMDLNRDPSGAIDIVLLVGSTNCVLALSTALIVRLNRRIVARLVNQAATDSLTGALNRRAFREQGEFAMAMCERQKVPCTIAYLDIDNFKRLNDDFGHNIGDRVLYSFCEELRSCIRSVDVLGRVGGDEFVVIFPSATVADVERCLDRIREQLDSNVTTEFLQFSCGIADALSARGDLDAAISNADTALYDAKEAGRNQNSVWKSDANLATN